MSSAGSYSNGCWVEFWSHREECGFGKNEMQSLWPHLTSIQKDSTGPDGWRWPKPQHTVLFLVLLQLTQHSLNISQSLKELIFFFQMGVQFFPLDFPVNFKGFLFCKECPFHLDLKAQHRGDMQSLSWLFPFSRWLGFTLLPSFLLSCTLIPLFPSVHVGKTSVFIVHTGVNWGLLTHHAVR